MNVLKFTSRQVSSTRALSTKVAVVFSGCGVYDGTEITEGVSTLIHLSASNTPYKIYAPDANQMHVINHTTGDEQEETRNVLVESARIARGDVSPLSTLDPSNYSALIIPGGFGAAKNLSSFATEGPDMSVNEDLASVIAGFKDQQKPLGACCIAPTILARSIPSASLTVGQSSGSHEEWPYQVNCITRHLSQLQREIHQRASTGILNSSLCSSSQEAAGAIEAMGGKHVDTEIDGFHIDEDNKIVTSAAYMKNATPLEVHESVGLMVKKVLSLI